MTIELLRLLSFHIIGGHQTNEDDVMEFLHGIKVN